ncbi:MAG: hypothetical protein ACOC2F_07995 [Bacteroidota bacterium]
MQLGEDPGPEDYEENELINPTNEVHRYDTKDDVLYLSGYSDETRSDFREDHEKLPVNIAGTHLLLYEDWKTGNREPSYAIELMEEIVTDKVRLGSITDESFRIREFEVFGFLPSLE